MSKNRLFPSREGALDAYFKLVVAYLIAQAERLGVSEENQAALLSLIGSWNTVYPLSKDTAVRTTTITENKNEVKKEMQTKLRSIYGDFAESALTALDRNTLNLPKPSATRTDAPEPSTRPICKVDTSERLQHTISFTDADGSRAKPKGVRGCQIWMKIGSPVADIADLDFILTNTRSPYIHIFDIDDAGKTVYYWLRWENTRGQTGPWSDPVMANVQG